MRLIPDEMIGGDKMEDGQKLLVGFDLCNDFSQMACYNYRTFEPESIGETLSEVQH